MRSDVNLLKILVILLIIGNAVFFISFRSRQASAQTAADQNQAATSAAAEEIQPAAEEAPSPQPKPDPEPEEEEEEEVDEQKALVSAGTSVNIRTGPGTGFDVAATVRDAAEVTVLEEEGDWILIRTEDGTEGYVVARFLTIIE